MHSVERLEATRTDTSVANRLIARHSAPSVEPPFWGAFGAKWLDPARVAGVAIWLASTVAGPAVVQLLEGGRTRFEDELTPAVLMSTGLLSLMMAHFAPRAATRSKVVAWCLGGGVLLGALNAGLSLSLGVLMGGGSLPDAVVVMWIGATFGAVAGGPIGFAFGLAFLYPTLWSHRLRGGRSCASGEHMLVHAGGWLVVISAVIALCQLAARHPAALWSCLGIGVLGGAATLAGFALRARRRQWLVRIARGDVERWSVRDAWDDDDVSDLPPFGCGAEQAGLEVIVYEGAERGGPYRCESLVTPLARC